MGLDMFSREVSYGGSFSADGAAVTFANFGPGLLVQSLQYMYQQAISRVYELGSQFVYLIAGRSQGQASLHRVMGPSLIMPAFYIQFGDVCNAGQNNIAFRARMGCGAASVGEVQRIGLRHAVISQVGGAVTTQDMILNETLGMAFLSLQFEEDSETLD